MQDDKYVVFKREDWEKRSVGVPVEDAVVIRRQDLFAPQALYVYAHSISIAAKILKDATDFRDTDALNDAKRLQDIADYFHAQADAAAAEAWKLPD